MSVLGHLQLASRSARSEFSHLAQAWSECYERLSGGNAPAHYRRDADIELMIRFLERQHASLGEDDRPTDLHFTMTRYWLLSTAEFLGGLEPRPATASGLKEDIEAFVATFRQPGFSPRLLPVDPMTGSLGYRRSAGATVISRRSIADRLLHLVL